MDNNNWRPAAAQSAEPPVEAGGDWRSQLAPESRQRISNKIMETLKRHLPFSGQEGLEELKKIAVRFEEKIYTAAVSQSDYLRKISMKMLTMESKSQNPLPSMSSLNNNRPPDFGASHNMQSQVHNQGEPLPMQMPANQAQAHQQILSQNIPNNMGSTGVQSSTNLTSALAPVSAISQTSIPSVVGQNPTIQNISAVTQSSIGNSMGQGIPSNMFANSQRQIPGRQQVVSQQQQQQPQNTQQFLYEQQLLKQKFHPQGNLQHTLVQSHIQQQQQQHQQQQQQQQSMQTSSVMQSSLIQANLSGLQHNQPSSAQQSAQSMLQHPQSILRQQQQAASVHQQQAPTMQPSLLPAQQQQHLMAQQPKTTNMQQNQLSGQQNNVGEMQQKQQRLQGQQNNLHNLQQQQLLSQQNNMSSMHQQPLGSQSNVSGLQQQQQLLGTQPGNPTMQNNQHSLHMLQHPKVQLQQQTQQNPSNMLQTHGHQSQQQLSQPQLMSQMQSQPNQLQQQLGIQQQPNQIQRDMHPGLQAPTQTPGPLLQQQNVIDQQKQLYQSQRPIAETSSTSLDSTAQTGHSNGGDWQEEVYQKIKAMKEMYLPELNEMYLKVASKLQLHDSLPQPPKSEQLEKLKMFKTMLERIITLLQVSKNNIMPGYKEKLGSYEKQIINLINTNKVKKSIPPLQQGQLGQPHMQQQQSQVSQLQSHDNQMNTQIQTMNVQGSVSNMQQNNLMNMQHTSLSSLSGVSTSQRSMMNSLQPASNLDSGQGNAMGSLQQTSVGSLQQNTVSGPQQTNVTNFTSQNGVNMLQPNISLQSNPNILQHQHLKQQQEQMLHSQQLKHRQMQQQILKQQMLQQQQQQQLHQQAKQSLPAQMQAHQMSQVHQMNDVNEHKIRQGMGVKLNVFQPHISGGQRTAYNHQQMKSGASFHISSPQLLQASSPQLLQHSSPQVDQQNLLSSLTKPGNSLQSANSPFITPSPSTPLAPSPMPGDSEKPVSGLSTLSNVVGNIGQQQATVTQPPAPSLAIGTPGISASPLLAEFTASDVGGHGSAMVNVTPGKSSVTEQPIERLIRAVKSISSQALSASVIDISSVVSMIDRIAGSAPGNGSRAAVGEDLVAMTNCRLQVRNHITQDGIAGRRKMKRYTSAMPLDVVSSAGSVSSSFKLSGPDTSDLESTATSSIKRPRIEANHALLEEIREINLRLIDTVVDVSEEDADPTAAAEGREGTIVKCSYIAVALSPSLKLQYASEKMSPIQPLRLLVPSNYPSCSPILLDKLPVEVSKEHEDLSLKTQSRFGISLRSLSQPVSLGDIARTWDVCARAVISEHAQLSGGGSFSSKYGTWESCLSA